ncbi:MAG: hypothetical protein NC926_00650 [Candidatus Omnitrophica bacterium]|nr:hypothetical protein [Candidatus Omnitrophota bacterium]
MKLLKVIFDIPIEKSFYYIYRKDINSFTRVLAPLGNQERLGFVIEIQENINDEVVYKEIKKVYDIYPLINEEIFKLSKIVSEKYYASLGQTIFTIIGELPLRYEKKTIERKEKKIFSPSGYRKEMYLFNNKKEKVNFYLDLISKTKGSLIFLFPEIEYVENYYKEMIKSTDKKVLKYYGEMNKKDRIKNYFEILWNENLIIIGTRLAIFLPVSDLNCIIIDQPSNSSHREKREPKYNAVEVAEIRAVLQNVPIIQTSNSLSINDYYRSTKKELIFIDKRNFESMPEIFIIEKKLGEMDKNINFLTKFTVSLMEETILKGKKVAIVHNRKGNFKTYKCNKCEHVLRCKICNSILILSENEKMVCKYCKDYTDMTKKCPHCGSKDIIERITGIEKIFRILKNTYPDFVIQKLTAEERIFSKDTNIFVGTTVITKILDKIDFGLVIFPHAESFLNIPQYNAEEVFFLTISEFLWNLDKNGKILIQTKNPHFEIFSSLKTKNFYIFYNKEIKIRQQLGYPPFSEIVSIEIPVKKSLIFEDRVNTLKKIISESGEILSSEKIKLKGKEYLKFILKIGERKMKFEDIMKIKEKMDFKIEINPEII